jgi:hypothetical protein
MCILLFKKKCQASNFDLGGHHGFSLENSCMSNIKCMIWSYISYKIKIHIADNLFNIYIHFPPALRFLQESTFDIQLFSKENPWWPPRSKFEAWHFFLNNKIHILYLFFFDFSNENHFAFKFVFIHNKRGGLAP